MRARNKVFHIDCFRCVACSRQLIPGDEFALRDDGLFCKADNDIVERSVNNNNSPSGENLEDSKDNVVVTDSKSGDDSPGNYTNTLRYMFFCSIYVKLLRIHIFFRYFRLQKLIQDQKMKK